MLLLKLSVLLLAASPEATWSIEGRDDGVVVFRRDRSDSPLGEFKATGMIDASPEEVWKVLIRFTDYKRITPFAERTEIRKVEDGGKSTHLYVLTNPPMISRRDYTVRYHDESEPEARLLKWELSGEGPPVVDGVVRVPHFEGYWRLESRDGGKKTFATCYLFSDPGGSLPAWLVNKLAGGGLRDFFRNIRGFVKA